MVPRLDADPGLRALVTFLATFLSLRFDCYVSIATWQTRPTIRSAYVLPSSIGSKSTGYAWLWGRSTRLSPERSTYLIVQAPSLRTAYMFCSPLRYGSSEL